MQKRRFCKERYEERTKFKLKARIDKARKSGDKQRLEETLAKGKEFLHSKVLYFKDYRPGEGKAS